MIKHGIQNSDFESENLLRYREDNNTLPHPPENGIFLSPTYLCSQVLKPLL